MKKILIVMMAITFIAGISHAKVSKFDKIPASVTLFQNVKVFHGTENMLHDVDVLVVKNKIHKIGNFGIWPRMG